MNHNWKNTVGAFAISFAMLGVTASGPASAKEKSHDVATHSSPKKSTAARAKAKAAPGVCLSYIVDPLRGTRVCAKTKIDSPK